MSRTTCSRSVGDGESSSSSLSSKQQREATTTSSITMKEEEAVGVCLTNEELCRIVESFPRPLSFAFAYGSGVFSQRPTTDPATNDGRIRSPMVDVILVTPDPLQFHRENVEMNRHHYATVPRLLGPKFVCRVQEWGPGVYFHPYVRVDDTRWIKYGVVSSSKLITDLRRWNWLYLAGRMHKPIVSLVPFPHHDDTHKIREAQEDNLTFALVTALLILSSTTNNNNNEITLTELFQTIASLSYRGDVRMKVGAEDPHKIQKLVAGHERRFWNLYRPIIQEFHSMGYLTVLEQRNAIRLRNDTSVQRALLERLPPRWKKTQTETMTSSPFSTTVRNLQRELETILYSSTRIQTMKGIVSSGIRNSWRYASAKFQKGKATN